MNLDQLEREFVLPVTPEVLYAAWLDGEGHARMTGAAASSDGRVGGAFTAWDGYIRGVYEDLQPGRAIVMRWRTAHFPPDAPDSLVRVELTPEGPGTRVRIQHTEIPEGQGVNYDQGWVTHYFEPMLAHFGGRAAS